jgi:hypothetical protein
MSLFSDRWQLGVELSRLVVLLQYAPLYRSARETDVGKRNQYIFELHQS